MKTTISENLVRVVILDVLGIYAQIHNQGYFNIETVDDIKKQYSDEKRWRVLVLE